MIAENIFNKQCFGIGREARSSSIDNYDYQLNSNPLGFGLSYHTQTGRIFLIRLAYKFK